MRMWDVDPRWMCRKHLLGEHAEMHMFVGCLRKGKNIGGYIRDGLVAVHKIVSRHGELAHEMQRRGYQHRKPLPDVKLYLAGNVDIRNSYKELASRCPDCRTRIVDAGML